MRRVREVYTLSTGTVLFSLNIPTLTFPANRMILFCPSVLSWPRLFPPRLDFCNPPSFVVGFPTTAKVGNLKAEVKKATVELTQTQRKLSQTVSQTASRGSIIQRVSPRLGQSRPSIITTVNEEGEGDIDSKAWYQLEMLRAQHCVLVEDLEQSTCTTAEESGDDESLRERALLAVACWQLRDNNDSNANAEFNAEEDSDAALELAAVAVAADLTSAPSDVPQKISDTLDWEVSRDLATSGAGR